MTNAQFLKTWSIIVGTMDFLTGIVLIFAPGNVMRLLKVETPPPDTLIFLSWIGVFVMSVGLSYGIALNHRARGEAVWGFTSLVRIMVAVFLVWHILDETMQKEWAVVAMVDTAVALVQIAVLRARWWKEVHR